MTFKEIHNEVIETIIEQEELHIILTVVLGMMTAFGGLWTAFSIGSATFAILGWFFAVAFLAAEGYGLIFLFTWLSKLREDKKQARYKRGSTTYT